MTKQEAADCLLNKAECRWCKASSENCRQEAERMGGESLLTETKQKEIGGIIKWLKRTKQKS